MGLKQLVVLGDSGVLGWGDRIGGGWCERLRLRWMQLPDAPVVTRSVSEGMAWNESTHAGSGSGPVEENFAARFPTACCSQSG